jgi:hypothetical protein
MYRRRVVIAAGILLIVALLVIAYQVEASSGNGLFTGLTAEFATLTPTATLSPTPTPVVVTATPLPPTATLVPTATSVPPTATPVPPTATPLVVPSAPPIQILSPVSGLTLNAGQSITIQSIATAPAGLTRVELWVDGSLYVSTSSINPATTSLAVDQIWSSTVPGMHTLLARAFDAWGRLSQSDSIEIQIVTPTAPAQPGES